MGNEQYPLALALGQRIWNLMDAKDLNILSLSVLAKLDEETVRNLVAGKNNVTLKTIEKISKALDLSISKLFEGLQ
jgi:transcriptional regulator with XRE-family HTH domain